MSPSKWSFKNRVACSKMIVLAPLRSIDRSSDVNKVPAPFIKPAASAENRSTSTLTFVRSISSSAAVHVVERTRSPKSWMESPGITVSRSMTASPSAVSQSKRTFATLASLCTTRSGSTPASHACCTRACQGFWSNNHSTSDWHPRRRSHASPATAASNAEKR